MDSIEQLSKKFQQEVSKNELREFAEKQTRELVLLKEENEHLKKLISKNESFIIQTERVSPEELICLTQINNLKKISDSADFTYEEVKKFSELVKTLRLIKGKEKADDLLKDFKTEDLIKVLEQDAK